MHRSTAELEEHLDDILTAPKDAGPLEMIVRRPAENEREVVELGRLTAESGLVGDDWLTRTRRGGDPHIPSQITFMNSRVADAVAISRDRWPLAGDQLYVDMDLSHENLPAGTRIKVGTATLEVSDLPHTGCSKFSGRFGNEALRFANVGPGRDNRFRGMYAFVIEDGDIKVGDKVTKL